MNTIVVDTNVWLDLLLFDDPRCAVLKAALSAPITALGAAQPPLNLVVSRSSREEFLAVLARPVWDATWVKRHPGEPLDRAAIQTRFEALTREVVVSAPAGLPVCRDVNDQPFVELAVSANASWLLTYDRALLKLARRMKTWGCRVATPQQWRADG